MTTHTQASLVRLDDTDLTIADPTEDIRGHKVVDQHGEEFGTVDGLLIDTDERKVRFLEVAAGGFLGIGERTFLLPVDTVSSIADDTVTIDRSREHVSGAPAYDPGVTQKETFWEETYGYYGYTPYWGAGYAFPGIGTMVGAPVVTARRPR
jgi:sporulation protein YlmC with PRC-barrel domain